MLEPHTEAKHLILRYYLDAWLPIMGTRFSEAWLVDAFAGPGRYDDGEPGSPIIMLRALLGHEQLHRIQARLRFHFIEADRRRAGILESEVDKLRPELGPNVDVHVHCASYEEQFPVLLAEGEAQLQTPPIFAFIDPFGYGDIPMLLAGRLVGLRSCEILLYLPVTFMARFVDEPDAAAALTHLYGDESWQPARNIEDLGQRETFLHDLFLERLREGCPHVLSFEITPAGRHTGYFLVFGTASKLGVEKIKEAMWRVDPGGGQAFHDSTHRDQILLIEPSPDFAALEAALRREFGAEVFSIEQAECFTLLETPFKPVGHLKVPVLKPAERDGKLEVVDPHEGRRRGSFTEGIRMRFVEP